MDNKDTENIVSYELTRLLYRNAPSSLIATIIVSLMFIYLQSPFVETYVIIFWFSCVLIVTLGRVVLQFAYKKANPSVDDNQKWQQWFIAGAGLSGLVWGVGSNLFYPEGVIANQLIVVIFVVAVSAAATTNLGVNPKCLIIFLTPLMAIAVPTYLSTGDGGLGSDALIIGMVVALYFFFIRSSINYSSIAQENIRARLEASEKEKEISRLREKRLDIFEDIVSSSGSIQSFIDKDLVYREVNKPFLQSLGRKREDIVDKSVEEVVGEEIFNGIIKSPLESCLQGNPEHHEGWRDYPDGSRHYFSTSFNPHFDETGTVQGAIVTSLDVTDRKEAEADRQQLEEQLFQARKMEAIGQLTGGIAHDFNNILQSILGYCELSILKADNINDAELRSYLDHIQHGGDRAQEMIKQLMFFSRSTPQESSRQSLPLLVENVLMILRPSISSNIKIVEDLQQDLPTVMINPVQFEQIVMNLCINSRDAITGAGEIEISAHSTHVERCVCDACHEEFEGDYIQIMIKDSGEGIPEEIRTTIFDPFFTTKALGKGTGMGLSVVHGITHNFGGHIRVESIPGMGTVFRLLFPAADPALEPVNVLSEQEEVGDIAPPDNKGGTILIVDDEPDITSYLGKLLQKHGFKTVEMNCSNDALDLYREKDRFDLVITDQAMPGLTGLELTREINKCGKNTAVIICTGNISDLSETPLEQSGACAYLSKPIKSSLLIDTINEVLKPGSRSFT